MPLMYNTECLQGWGGIFSQLGGCFFVLFLSFDVLIVSLRLRLPQYDV